MTRKIALGRTLLAATALTALGVAAATPAAAHTNNMFTYAYEETTNGFATYGKTDGVAAFLPTHAEVGGSGTRGIEVWNELGYQVGNAEGFFIRTWNHATGEAGEPRPIFMPVLFTTIQDVNGLDTLAGGTVLTLIEYRVEETIDLYFTHFAIAKIDPVSGEVAEVFGLDDVIVDEQGNEDYGLLSLATDPTSGITYVFLGDDDGLSYFFGVDVATGTEVTEPTQFGGAGFTDGDFQGADFDAGDGSLYFNYYDYASPFGQPYLARLGAPSTWATAPYAPISVAPANFESTSIAPLALTIEYTALAATGSEVPLAAIVILGSVATLAGGVTVVVARRRSAAGRV